MKGVSFFLLTLYMPGPTKHCGAADSGQSTVIKMRMLCMSLLTCVSHCRTRR